MSHVLKISGQKNHNKLNENIQRFWNLDVIGISPNESLVYKKFGNDIKFKENRYFVNLPIKDYDPLLPDIGLKRLHNCKKD